MPVLPGSTVKPLRGSRVAVAEPGAVITAALKQRSGSLVGGLYPAGLELKRGEVVKEKKR